TSIESLLKMGLRSLGITRFRLGAREVVVIQRVFGVLYDGRFVHLTGPLEIARNPKGYRELVCDNAAELQRFITLIDHCQRTAIRTGRSRVLMLHKLGRGIGESVFERR